MIPVYHLPRVMFLKFFFIHKTFFAQVCLLMIYLTWQNFPREKWRHQVAKIFTQFCFYFILKLSFYVQRQSAQNVCRLTQILVQSKGPHTHNNTHEKYDSIFSFMLFMFLQFFLNKKNQRIMSDKNNEHILFTHFSLRKNNFFFPKCQY